MRKLLLLSLPMIVMLVCMWAIGAQAVTTPKDSDRQDLTTGRADTPEDKADSDAKHLRMNAIIQERLPGEKKVSQAEKPIILTPSFLDRDGTVIDGREKKPFEGKANVPNPGLILQGGDDIGSATPIATLPYTDAGTTEGYTDDYDEQCPNPSGSPDVVYSYAPAGNETVDIYAWGTDETQFDTKLYLYENTYTPGNPFACNDDFFNYGEAALQDLALTGGNTYYVVLDGYGGEYGEYNFHMLESPPRPPNNNCSSSPDTTLVNGYTFTFTGTEVYALDTDDWFDGPEVFLPFIVPYTMDILFDECGADDTRTTWLNIGENCPLDGSTTSADPQDGAGEFRDGCIPDDDNIVMYWEDIPPGIYNYPMFGQFPDLQPYEVHLTGHGCDGDGIKVKIMTDSYPEETTWSIRDHVSGALVDSGGPYDIPNRLIIQHVCLDPDGCYDFTVYDLYGDGMCCYNGDGYYEVYYNGELVGEGGESFYSETIANIGPGCIGACCVEGDCVATNRLAECNIVGGFWFVDESCVDYECPPPVFGACCYNDNTECAYNYHSECHTLGGYWHPYEDCTEQECLDVIYHEDFDSEGLTQDLGDWAGVWEVTNETWHTPINCMTDTPDGNYGSHDTLEVELMIDINLTGYPDYALEFYTKFEIELGFDWAYFDISSDGGSSWINAGVFNGEEPEDYIFHKFTAPLGGYYGQSVRFKFTMLTDPGYFSDGIYVDDFYVYGLPEDISAPLILHTPPTDSTSVPEELTAVATILDYTGVAFANLTYAVDEGAPTTIGPDQVVGDEYTFIIPQQEAGAHIEYYITAEDDLGYNISTPTYHYVSGIILFFDDGVTDFIYTYELDEKAAVRFTPPTSATLVGGMIRLYTDVEQPPLDSVDVEVWDNDVNDLPGNSLFGPMAVWPGCTLEEPERWTYVDLRGQGLTFAADEDFHFGCGFRTAMNMTGDAVDLGEHSSSFQGGGPWSHETDINYNIRVILGPGPPGACCVDLICVATNTQEECDVLGGQWYEGETCPEFECPAGCDYVVGDVNGSNSFNGLDVGYSVDWFKYQLNPPQCEPCELCPGWFYCGDVNGSCSFNGLDVGYMVDWFKYQNNPPVPCGDCPPIGGLHDDGDTRPTIAPKTIKSSTGMR